MPAQPSLRPFDIAVALRLVLVPEERYEPLATALATSTSAVHRSVARLQLAGICGPGSRTVRQDALMEFLEHGVRFAFPAVHGPERVGFATAYAHPEFSPVASPSGDVRATVWPTEAGTVRGESIAPLFTGLTRVVAKDTRMHTLLAGVDAMRVGSPAQREAAAAHFRAVLSAKAA